MPATFPAPPADPPPMVTPREQTSAPAVPRQPSRYAEWAQDKYMKALEAPEMVSAFHSGAALQIPPIVERRTAVFRQRCQNAVTVRKQQGVAHIEENELRLGHEFLY